jgi:mediator of RNA polymerase II transcription subunit 23
VCWISLQTSDFFPVIRLYDLLYPEEDPLPVPNVRKAVSCHKMAPVCVWIHLMKKAATENISLGRNLPRALSAHHAYLDGLVNDTGINLAPGNRDFRVALLCNAFSTNQDVFPRPMGALVEIVHAKKVTTPMPGNNCSAGGPTAPLSMDILDALTVHAKMSLIHNIVTHVIKLAQAQSKLALAPALVETYSRLLVYMEIESLGIKGFISE